MPAVATGLEKVSFHSSSKERQCQRMFRLLHNLHSSHTLAKSCSKFSKPGFNVCEPRTSRCSGCIQKTLRNQRYIANILWILKKESSRKTPTSLLIMPKPLTVWSQQTVEMEISDHLTCLLRNLYAGQEATARTRHGTKDWFQIGKGVC